MAKTVRNLIVLLIGLVFGTMYVFAQDGQHAYVGAQRCMPCHMVPAKGAQYKQWMGSKHAQAYKTLGTEEAKKYSDNPQEDPECLKCHVTGYEASDDLKTDKYDQTNGVWCESCHGPGGDYWKMNIMKQTYAGELDPAKVGLTAKPGEETCLECHNDESPTFTGFNFEEAYKKIAHPIPQEENQ